MDYIIKGDNESLQKLRGCFAEACRSRGLNTNSIRLLMILLDFIDLGKKAGLITDIKE